MNVIYIDVLIIINLYVTYFLIKATCVFLHKKPKTIRVLCGALFGGAGSAIILLPELPFLINLLIKIVLGFIIVFIFDGFRDLNAYLRYSLIFIVINMFFAGIMLAIWLLVSPSGMFFNNGIVYFDISFAVITLSTAFSYGIIKLLRYILDTRLTGDENYSIIVKNNGKEIKLNAFPDTGNSLTDFFSGLPVIICDSSACGEIIPCGFDLDNPENIVKGVRLLPFNTVDSSGLLPVFRPDSITIINLSGSDKAVSALIGISKARMNKDGANALFNPKLLL